MRQTVSGEVTGTDRQFRLPLRIDGQEFFYDAEGSAFGKMEDVMDAAAVKLLTEINPVPCSSSTI
jgi:hypothetical protein